MVYNLYVIFTFNNWNEIDRHPTGKLYNTIGPINNNVSFFYEYQLYCKKINTSITNFNKQI